MRENAEGHRQLQTRPPNDLSRPTRRCSGDDRAERQHDWTRPDASEWSVLRQRAVGAVEQVAQEPGLAAAAWAERADRLAIASDVAGDRGPGPHAPRRGARGRDSVREVAC